MEKYAFPIGALDSFIKHIEIDHAFGHADLLFKHGAMIQEIKPDKLHHIVNLLHDLKHGFDLQKLEIIDYYNKEGQYLPRQFVSFFAI